MSPKEGNRIVHSAQCTEQQLQSPEHGRHLRKLQCKDMGPLELSSMTRESWRKIFTDSWDHTHTDAHSHYHSQSCDREIDDFQKSVNVQLEGGASSKARMLEGALP